MKKLKEKINIKEFIINQKEKINIKKLFNYKKIKSHLNLNKIKEIFTLRRIIKNEALILALYIFIMEILFKILTETINLNYSILRIFISSLVLGTFLKLLFNFIGNKHIRKTFYIIISFIVAIYALAQVGFYNFLGNYASLNTSSQLGKVTDYFGDYMHSFKTEYYLLLLPFALFVTYIIRLKMYNGNLSKKKYGIFIAILSILYVLTLNISFMQNKFQYMSNKELFSNPSLPSVSVNQFGISIFGILDVKSKLIGQKITTTDATDEDIDYSRNIDDEEINTIIEDETDETMNTLNKYFYSQSISEKNDYTGMFEGKNVIFIMMESVNNLMINEEYFPTLYKLYNEGISFTNNYSPRNNCSTGNNEFSALTSLYTINNVCSANEYKNNTYFESVFNLFKNKGYDVTSFHNYTEKYYYRSTIHKNLGSTYYGVQDLNIEYSNQYGVWPSDIDLVENSFDIFTSGTSENFMTLLTTVTTHQPYGVSSEYGDKYLSLFEDLEASESVKRYLSKMIELDKAMERLLEMLEEEDLLEDTVLVMFGDHYPYGIKTSELQSMFNYDLEERKEIERTPFIIYNSETKSDKIDSYTSYINILPTVANLFDLDYDPRLYVGEDLFSSNYSNMTIFADGSWQSKYAYYDAENSKLTYINEDYTYTDEEIIEINRTINLKITMSNLAITKNYFNYLEEKLNPDVDSDDENKIASIEE